jgi:protein tyrosine/serine phosphatase
MRRHRAAAYGEPVKAVDARFVDLRGAYNFRDLGGLPTVDGRVTRSGVMFRSDALHHLEPDDIDQLVLLGITTIIDLRSAVEVERHGRGALADEPIGWVHAPLTNPSPDDKLPPALAAGNLGEHYSTSLGERTVQLANVIELLSSRDHLPAVFHCTAGKDRTGIVAALVLSLVDVEPDAIVDDYALTDPRMPMIIARLRGPDTTPELAQALAAGVARAEATSMRTFLVALDRGYGGAAGWARAAGVGDDTIARLRRLLVDDSR